MLCCELSLVNRDTKQPQGTVLRCRSWTCENCVEYRRRSLKRLARAGKPTCFITLTSNPATGETPDDRARALVRAWRLIVKRAKRKFGMKRLPYLTVIEATKNGEPHLHILARLRWLPQKWLSEQCADLVGAPIVWIERINADAKIAAYVAKYIGKAPHKFGGVKRYWRSLDYIVDRQAWEDEKNSRRGNWSIANYSLDMLRHLLRRSGYDIEEVRPGYIRGSPNGGLVDEFCWMSLFGLQP